MSTDTKADEFTLFASFICTEWVGEYIEGGGIHETLSTVCNNPDLKLLQVKRLDSEGKTQSPF